MLEFATGVEGGNCWILVLGLGQVLELWVVLDGIGCLFWRWGCVGVERQVLAAGLSDKVFGCC